MDIVQTEVNSIDAISFVPLNKASLCSRAQEAEAQRKLGNRCSLLSKLFQVPASAGLLPASLDPSETVLSKMGRSAKISGAYFAVIKDRNMPLGGGSCGVNGVLHKYTSEKYGRFRMNLFCESEKRSLEMAQDYIQFRTQRLPLIFSLYVEALCSFEETYKLDPTKETLLSEALKPSYRATCAMMKCVLESLYQVENPTAKDLSALGIGVTSFCQTWQKGAEVGTAQFSVMSPHFQTRFYVSDHCKLPRASLRYLEGYRNMIDHFTQDMKDKGYAHAFVNIDRLVKTSQVTANANEHNAPFAMVLFAILVLLLAWAIRNI